MYSENRVTFYETVAKMLKQLFTVSSSLLINERITQLMKLIHIDETLLEIPILVLLSHFYLETNYLIRIKAPRLSIEALNRCYQIPNLTNTF